MDKQKQALGARVVLGTIFFVFGLNGQKLMVFIDHQKNKWAIYIFDPPPCQR